MPETTAAAAKLDLASLIHPGTIAEQVELQLGLLTQGVAECMMLATGAFPDLTEGPPSEPELRRPNKPVAMSSWQAARSAELRDAARLSEATARLLTGFARLRGQFSQDFTIRHSDRRAGADAKDRQRNTTITHNFSVPGRDSVPAQRIDPGIAGDLSRNLSGLVETAVRNRDAAQEDGDDPVAELERRLDALRERTGAPDVDADKDTTRSDEAPPPPPPAP